MNMNALRELMEFANQNQMFGQGWNSEASSYDPRGRRAQWAMEQMNKQQSEPMMGMEDDDMSAPSMQYVRPKINAGPRQEQPATNFLRTLFERQPYGPGVRSSTGGIRG
jgi:hypothetical protein